VPLVATVPDHPPDAVHAVAFEELHVNVDTPPLAILAGLALRLTAGSGATATVVEVLADPPVPVQVKV
jgi:hypothetical protein